MRPVLQPGLPSPALRFMLLMLPLSTPTPTPLPSLTPPKQTPFLIKGVLREYQQIGVDWLVTLYHKRLNGEHFHHFSGLQPACPQ